MNETRISADMIRKASVDMAANNYTNKTLKMFAMLIALYFAVAGILYWVVHEDWSVREIQTDAVNEELALDRHAQGEGLVVEQSFVCSMDAISQIELFPATYGVVNEGDMTLQLLDEGTVLWENTYDMADAPNCEFQAFSVEPPVEGANGKELVLRVVTKPETEGGIALFYGNTVTAGKFDVQVELDGELTLNGEPVEGELVMRLTGEDYLYAIKYFWPVCLVIFVLCAAVAGYYAYCRKTGRRGFIIIVFEIAKNYQYLLKQLVVRDFKLKYKASMLGVFWSFLNPLLSMMVYYFVFSTVFKNDIKGFPVYLLCGITLLNYFVESTTLGLSSIVNNSALITKVYMPKFIYPISRTISSAINMVIAIIPLFIAMLVTGMPYSKAMLLIPLVMLFLIIFSAGVSMILSCMMVFFRDTQFLWSVVSMLLNFLTPVFYPETIIPSQFIDLYRMNPLYQFITFMRCLVIDGAVPEPMAFVRCIAASVPVLLLGLFIFRKKQDRFVFYL